MNHATGVLRPYAQIGRFGRSDGALLPDDFGAEARPK
jgi:hypothetical protein